MYISSEFYQKYKDASRIHITRKLGGHAQERKDACDIMQDKALTFAVTNRPVGYRTLVSAIAYLRTTCND